MPRIVDELPKSQGRGREKKYNFGELFDSLLKSGKACELVEGEDFDCTPASIKQQLYKEAKNKGLKASIRQYSEGEGDNATEIVVFAVQSQEQADKEKAERERKEKERKAKAAQEAQS